MGRPHRQKQLYNIHKQLNILCNFPDILTEELFYSWKTHIHNYLNEEMTSIQINHGGWRYFWLKVSELNQSTSSKICCCWNKLSGFVLTRWKLTVLIISQTPQQFQQNNSKGSFHMTIFTQWKLCTNLGVSLLSKCNVTKTG